MATSTKMTSSTSERRVLSWPLATWVAPLVPALSLLALVVTGEAVDLGDDETSGYALALGLSVGTGVLGALLLIAGGRRARGLGAGLVVGSTVTALGWAAVLLG